MILCAQIEPEILLIMGDRPRGIQMEWPRWEVEEEEESWDPLSHLGGDLRSYADSDLLGGEWTRRITHWTKKASRKPHTSSAVNYYFYYFAVRVIDRLR